MNATMITVKYTCDACDLFEVACEVVAREEEDVKGWFALTVRTVWEDHRRRSPRCHPEALTNMLIPITGTERIGGATIQ